jgi:hypothetical protein
LVTSLSGTVTSPEDERVGFTLPRWMKLNMVNESTPMASAAWRIVNWLDANVVISPVFGRIPVGSSFIFFRGQV